MPENASRVNPESAVLEVQVPRSCRYVRINADMKTQTLLLRTGRLCAALLALTVTVVWSHQARAGMITVVGDVSAPNNFSFLDAVLGNQSSVVFSRGPSSNRRSDSTAISYPA